MAKKLWEAEVRITTSKSYAALIEAVDRAEAVRLAEEWVLDKGLGYIECNCELMSRNDSWSIGPHAVVVEEER